MKGKAVPLKLPILSCRLTAHNVRGNQTRESSRVFESYRRELSLVGPSWCPHSPSYRLSLGPTYWISQSWSLIRSRGRENRLGDAVDRLQKARNNLVGIALRVRAPIFEIAAVPVFDEVDGQPDRSAAIRKTKTEFVDRLRLVQTGQAQMVVGTVDGDVIGNCFLEGLH